jgi:tRNA 2-thiouridine synthesizing protein E
MDDDWTPQMAEDLAAREGISLDEKHWRVIAASREAIARRGRVPSPHDLATLCGVSLDELNHLFPGPPDRLLSRLAGAPELERNRR